MRAVVHYLLAEHTRSRGFVAALVVLVGGVIVLYAQPPNPVLSTAGTVAAFLFPVQCWIAYGFFNSQGEGDRQALAATVGGRTLVAGRMIAAALLAVASSLFALLLPLVAGLFKRAPHLDEVALILVANLLATLAASALAAPFSVPTIRNRALSLLALLTIIVLSIPLRLPPLIPTARALDTSHAARVPGRIAGEAAIIVAFVIVASAGGGWLWRKRE